MKSAIETEIVIGEGFVLSAWKDQKQSENLENRDPTPL